MAGGNIQAIHDWIVDKKGSKEYVDNFSDTYDDGLMSSSQVYMNDNYLDKNDLEEIIFNEDIYLSATQTYMNNFFDKEKVEQLFIQRMKSKNMPSLKYYIDIVTPANKLNYYDGETIDITGISIHKFSKEDDTDLEEINLADITFTNSIKLTGEEKERPLLDIENYPFSYSDTKDEILTTNNGSRTPVIKANNGKTILIVGKNCCGDDEGGGWSGLFSISDSQDAVTIKYGSGTLGTKNSFFVNNKTYYVSWLITSQRWGGNTEYYNSNNYLELQNTRIINVNRNMTEAQFLFLYDYLCNLIDDNTSYEVKIKTYDEDGYLMECSYNVEVEQLIPLTYKMTGNILPKGEVNCSSFYNNNYAPWYCFDKSLGGADQKTWATTQLLPQWIQYKFEVPKIVRKIVTVNKFAGTIRAVKYFTLQGSNDGEEYINIQVCNIKDASAGYEETIYINNDTAYLYYRLYVTSNYSSSGNDNNYGCGFEEIELYGLAEENPPEDPIYLLTPAMTSNTTPSGEVNCSNNYNANYLPYYAFNQVLGSNTQTWATIQTLPQWIQYKFDTPKIVTKIATTNRNEGNIRAAKTYILQGSNDGSTYVDIQTCSIQSYAAHYQEIVNIENETAYLYYRLYVTEQYSNTGTGCGFAEIGLYGYDAE